MADNFDKALKVAELMRQSVGNVFGLMTCIPDAVKRLRLNLDQIIAFCEATPDGEALWLAFTARRDSLDTPDDYDFLSFVSEVLARTDHPVV